jgi:hypothetical protein
VAKYLDHELQYNMRLPYNSWAFVLALLGRATFYYDLYAFGYGTINCNVKLPLLNPT